VLAAAVLACAGLAIPVWQEAAAQSVLRSQTRILSGAVSRQVRQAFRPKLTVRNDAGTISTIDVSLDGRSLAMVAEDGLIRVWDLDSGRQLQAVPGGGRLTALDVGAMAATAAGAAAPARTRGSKSRAVTTAPVGARAVLIGDSNGNAVLIDALSGATRQTVGGHGGAVRAVALAPDGTLAASAAADGGIKLWDTATGQVRATLTGHQGQVNGLAFSPDGKALVSGGDDRQVILWSPADGREVRRYAGHGDKVSRVAFGPGGAFASGDRDGTVMLWSTGSAAATRSWSAHGDVITALHFDGSGQLVTAAGERSALIWTAGGQRQAELRDADGKVGAALFVPGVPTGSAGTVITASEDGRAKVWDSRTGTVKAQLILTRGGWTVTDQAGRFDGSEAGNGNVAWSDSDLSLDIENFSDPYYEPGLLAKTLRAPAAIITARAAPVEQGVGMPPTAKLSAPGGTSVSAPGPARIEVVAEDQGGGLDAVKLYHNDKAVDPGRVASQDTGQGRNGERRTLTYTVDLVGGRNAFRAVAASAEGIDGPAGTLTIQVSTPPAEPTLHVVVVGINTYASSQLTLNYAVADAKGFVQWARNRGRQAYGGGFKLYELYDRAATKAAIMKVLADLRTAAPDDVVVLYLAGHGENANNNWHFLPTEFGRTLSYDAVAQQGISSREIQTALQKMGPQRVFMLIDACKSGNLRRAFAGDADRKDIQGLSRGAGIHILAATDKEQLAVELEQLGHGAFTYTVLDALQGRADTSPRDGTLRAKEVLSYSVDTVPVVAYKYTQEEQHPTTYSRGADFTIGR